MPAEQSSNEATFRKFFRAISDLNWANAIDCVARDFRGTISGTQRNLTFSQYREEMERVRSALNVTKVTEPAITVHGDKITAVYEVHAIFAHDLQPQRGSRAEGPLRANNKPVNFDVQEVCTFNDAGEIVRLVSDSLGEKVVAQMTA